MKSTTTPLRWAIVAPGAIARAFAADMAGSGHSRVQAVASRNIDRARAFAAQFGIASAYGSYEQAFADPNVDAVYIASPHSHHHDQALAAIAAGKPVLVEKAFTRNQREARAVIDAARAAGVFCMEAMWTRFLPHIAGLHAIVDRGEIGEIISLTADHGQQFAYDSQHRLFNPELAGGALLDLGVYPVAFAHDFLGVPDAIRAVGQLTAQGVDGQTSMCFVYGERTQALATTTLWASTATTASITGTEGRIEISGPFYTPAATYTVIGENARPYSFTATFSHGLRYEAAEVARCLQAGLLESPRMTHADTLEIMGIMDEVRAQIGVRYPGE